MFSFSCLWHASYSVQLIALNKRMRKGEIESSVSTRFLSFSRKYLGRKCIFMENWVAFDMNLCHFNENWKVPWKPNEGEIVCRHRCKILPRSRILLHRYTYIDTRTFRTSQNLISLSNPWLYQWTNFPSHEHICNAENFPSPKHLTV